MEVRPLNECLNVVRVRRLSNATSGVLKMENGVVSRFAVDASLPDNVLGVPRAWLPYLPPRVSVSRVDEPLGALECVEFAARTALPCWPLDECDMGVLLAGLVVGVGSLATVALYGRVFVLQALSCTSRDASSHLGTIGKQTRISVSEATVPVESRDCHTSDTVKTLKMTLDLISQQTKRGMDRLVDRVLCVVGASKMDERAIVADISKDTSIVRPPVALLLPDPEFPDASEESEDMLQQWAERHGAHSAVAYILHARVLSAQGVDKIVRRLCAIMPRATILVFRDTPIDGRAVKNLSCKTSFNDAAENRLRHAVNTSVRGMSAEDSLRLVALAGRVTAAHGAHGRALRPTMTTWASIAGYDALKARVRALVYRYGLGVPAAGACSEPLTLGGLASALPPVRGVLLHGPSGCGKSMIVAALASDAVVPVIALDAPTVLGRYLGESEAAVRAAFAAARAGGPAIIVVENVEFLGARRAPGTDDSADAGGVGRRLLSTLLNELDGIGDRLPESDRLERSSDDAKAERPKVLVVATTTDMGLLDDALLRPGRLDHHVLVDLPSSDDRVRLFVNAARRLGVPHVPGDIELLSARTEGLSCADVVGLVASAAFHSQSLVDLAGALA